MKITFRKMFSINLYRLRVKAGMSQKSLAEAIEVGQNTISRWESGYSEPSFNHLELMCKVLNTDMNTLFDVHPSLLLDKNK